MSIKKGVQDEEQLLDNSKEIRNKIYNIKNMQKITKAMELVAASKMRKTQQRMKSSIPYITAIKKVIGHVTMGNLKYIHPYLKERTLKKVGYLIISTDHGLCGGLNINLFKKILIEITSWLNRGISVNLAIIGTKGLLFFSNFNKVNIIAKINKIEDHPKIVDFKKIIRTLLEAYDRENIDKLYLAYNKFTNTMLQTPIINQLIPLPYVKDKQKWDYLYESNPKSLLNILLLNYIDSQVYQGILENLASEQAARMMAMKVATENGDNIIKELQLIYNKVRQASITQELTEIISGAAVIL